MPIKIQSRSDVFYILLQMAHSRGMLRLARMWEDGETEFFGGFNNIHEGRPGWIMAFGFENRREFYALVAGPNGPYMWPVDEVDWGRYDGSESTNPLYCGDKPKEYKELKAKGVIWRESQRSKT